MRKNSDKLLSRSQISWPLLTLLCGGTFYLANLAAENLAPTARSAMQQPLADTARGTLARTFARLIEDAIPQHYDKQKDWGKTKNITVGLDLDDGKLHRRKKPVNHGVWKHYQAWLVNPEQNLSLQIENFRTLDGGRVGFTLLMSAKIDLWARAKIYEYGVHIIALEASGQTAIDLSLDCEVGVKLQGSDGKSYVALDPRVTDARLTLREFRLDRVSNAHGPIVAELGEGVKKLVEDELEGPALTAKLNRAIDKKRDRLKFSLPGLMNSSWWPLAELPALDQALEKEQVLKR